MTSCLDRVWLTGAKGYVPKHVRWGRVRARTCLKRGKGLRARTCLRGGLPKYDQKYMSSLFLETVHSLKLHLAWVIAIDSNSRCPNDVMSRQSLIDSWAGYLPKHVLGGTCPPWISDNVVHFALKFSTAKVAKPDESFHLLYILGVVQRLFLTSPSAIQVKVVSQNWLRIRTQGPKLPPGRSRKVKISSIKN